MKRLLIQPLVESAARWFDDTVATERLQAFLVQRLGDFRERCTAQGDRQIGGEAAADVARAWHLAVRAGLLAETAEQQAPCEPTDEPSLEEIRRWIEEVPDGKVVTPKRLVAGTGRWMNWIEETAAVEHREFLQWNLEALLRNVEVKRARCLQPVLPPASPQSQWLEKHDVAILFARSARRRRDLRFLNGALKLNDWAFPAYRRPQWDACSARYLLALAEQELTAAKLLV